MFVSKVILGGEQKIFEHDKSETMSMIYPELHQFSISATFMCIELLKTPETEHRWAEGMVWEPTKTAANKCYELKLFNRADIC